MKLADKVRAVRVLRTAGMPDLRRPVRTATSSLAMRRLGPIAGAAQTAARRGPRESNRATCSASSAATIAASSTR